MKDDSSKGDGDGDCGTRGSSVGDDLLVDFPHVLKLNPRGILRRNTAPPLRSLSSCTLATTSSYDSKTLITGEEGKTTTTRRRRSSYITFSKYCEVYDFENDNDDDEASRRKSYTGEDYTTFKHNIHQDLHDIKHKLATSPADADTVHECVGLERVFTSEINRTVKLRQAAHFRTILKEQERQDMRGIVDVEALSKLSFDSSEWTRDRAHNLASAYWNVTRKKNDKKK